MTPTWYLTAQHRTFPTTPDGEELPFGTAHVRKLGDSTTPCGLPAMYWPVFWLLTIDDAADICAECESVAREQARLVSYRRLQ